jgi:2-aminoadipate transaminase
MGHVALQYGKTEGYIPLREKLCKRMKNVGINSLLEEIIITSGAQQAIDLTAKLFLNHGETVICESPTYLAALNAFKSYGANLIDISMDHGGMVMEELERKLIAHPETKFIYTIPDFQNPTGRTLEVSRRKKMVELANRFDVLIVEDNPYGAIRFSGSDLPPIKHFDTEGRVIYISSFSKIFAPGLRLGWICAETTFIDRYVTLKQATDLHTDSLAQIITSKYIELYDIEMHIAKIKQVYKERCNTMLICIQEYFPEEVSYTIPEGGLFIWIEIPMPLDSRDIFNKCLKRNVSFVPGTSFFPNKPKNKNNTIRLNYSNMSNERIIEGMKHIGDVLKLEISKVSTGYGDEGIGC